MRILVTGVSGQVGGALLTRLREHDIIAADRSTIDLARPNEIVDVLERLNPALIINAAAYTAVDQAEKEPDLATLVNAIAPGMMACWAAEKRIPFVHFSTDYVFDGSGDRPWRENDMVRPLSVYGRTKLEGEQAVQAATGTTLIVRTSWVYDAKGKNFLRTIARLAREREQVRIVADQVGAPTSAAVIADGLAHMLSGNVDALLKRIKHCDGIVHLTATGETSWYGFACAIVEGLKVRKVSLVVKEFVPIETKDYPVPTPRPHNSRLDLSVLRDVFGVTPEYWRQALERELDILAAELRPTEGPSLVNP